jgi:VTT domain
MVMFFCQKIGIDVHVYEQARVLREVGAGINVPPNATRAIHALGLGDKLAELGVRPTDVHQRRWEDGRILLRSSFDTEIERLFGFHQYQSRSEAFIARDGAASDFLARFVAVVRAFVPLVSGILRMPPRQFYAANILSAFAWAPVHVFPSVLLAMALRLTDANREERTGLVIAGLIVTTLIILATHSYLRRKDSNLKRNN